MDNVASPSPPATDFADGAPMPSPGHDRHGRQCRAVEADLVRDGGLVAASLLGSNVNDHRAVHVAQRATEHRVQRRQAVAGHRAGVRDAQVLEQLARLGEVDDRLAQPARQSSAVGPMIGIRSTASS